MVYAFLNSARRKKGERCMAHMTHLSQNLEGTEHAAKYDEAAKKLISDKQVLARIVKGTVKEFEDYSIEEIIWGIEKKPEVAVREVYPGKKYKRKDPGAIQLV